MQHRWTIKKLVGTGFLALAGLGWAAMPTKADDTIFFQKTNGSGASLFQWGVTFEGNLVNLQSPAGFEHIRVGTIDEGYQLTDGTFMDGWSVADDGEAGFTNISVTIPNANSIVITRDTGSLPAAFHYRLTQTFTQDTGKRTVIITCKVTNLESFTIFNAGITRYVDLDIDNNFSDDFYGRTHDSIFAWNDEGSSNGAAVHGVSLEAVSYGFPILTKVQDFGSFSSTVALPTNTSLSGEETTPVGPADSAGRVFYNLGTLKPLQSKTVVFNYHRH